MPESNCSRCESRAAGLERAPLPGELGQEVQAAICAPCWNEWLGAQVRLINEYRLSPVNPEHFAFLVKEMRTFLNLPTKSE